MNKALRKERIGVVHAARMWEVPVSEIKKAIRSDMILNGHRLPDPIRVIGPTNTQYFFSYGQVEDFAEKMKEN